ncbi:hypothetical protein PENSPDRAFT_679306 [Peniophora sp. CONT]|nr:hypothetical protein PENSPDRAFT_679306 [Peniophora sp. CONT]
MPSISIFSRRTPRRAARSDCEASPTSSSSSTRPTLSCTVSKLAGACRPSQPHHVDRIDLTSDFTELKPYSDVTGPRRKRSPTTTTIVLDISAANAQQSPISDSDAGSLHSRSNTWTPPAKENKPVLEPYVPHAHARSRVQSAPRSSSLPRSSTPRTPSGPRAPPRSRTSSSSRASSSTYTASPATPLSPLPPVPPIHVHTRPSSWHMLPPVQIVPPTPADIHSGAVSLNDYSPRTRLSAPGSPLRPLPVPPPSAPASSGEYFAGAQGVVMTAQEVGQREKERRIRAVKSAFDLGKRESEREKERERKGRVEKTRSVGEVYEAPPPYEF